MVYEHFAVGRRYPNHCAFDVACHVDDSEETIKKVLQARDELGYVPNSAARNLKVRHSRLIGIIVPSFRMPFFADIIQSMQDNAPEDVNLVFIGSTADNLQSSIYSLVERGVQALAVQYLIAML